MSKLLYRGPALETLHQQYAKHGRIDEMAPVRAYQAIHIEAAPTTVWEVLAATAQWPSIDAAISDVHIAERAAADVSFTWRNGRSRIDSRFAVVDRERELSWTGVSSGVRAVHRHILHAEPHGATRLEAEESMAAPLLSVFYSSAKLGLGLSHWLNAIKTAAERRAAQSESAMSSVHD